jgi:hypothetical protein
MGMRVILVVLIPFFLSSCKEGSNFGITAGFAGAEVGYKYNAPRKSRAKKKKATPTPTPTPTPTATATPQ